MSILIISGTNRTNNKSLKIANLYAQKLISKNIDAEILSLTDLPKDYIYSALYENSGKNPEFNQIREKIASFKKIIFVVAEYNGSFPGVLKAFIDGLKYPDSLKNKKFALVGLSSGIQGGALALSHLTDVISYLNGNVLGNRMKIYKIEENFKDGKITNSVFEDLINVQIEEFIAF